MRDFDFFRLKARRFAAKTTNAALRALESGILPVEGFIYTATSSRPLDEEPYDIDAIERALGRETLDIETNLLLMRILRRLLGSPQQEIALFAAEGVNLIEGRYAKRIEELKAAVEKGPAPELVSELGELYAELSRLYPPESSLRGFYLHEAYLQLTTRREMQASARDETVRLIRVLISLGLYDQAAEEINGLPEDSDPKTLFLRAEIEFQRRNYTRVLEICHRIRTLNGAMTREEHSLLASWLGPDGA